MNEMRSPAPLGVGVLLALVMLFAGAICAGANGGFGNQELPHNPFGVDDNEPAIKVGSDGAIYIGAIRGLPSGIDIWRLSSDGSSPLYLGDPDSVIPSAVNVVSFCCLSVGGGDMDLAINDDRTVAYSSLTAASVTVGTSMDRGATFLSQPLGSLIPGDDRQWNTSDGTTMYMSFVDAVTGNIDIEKSAPPLAGLVYVPVGQALSPLDPAVGNNQHGNIVADRQNVGRLYQAYTSPAAGSGHQNQIGVAVSSDGGSSWTQQVVFAGAADKDYNNIFPVVAVDHAGNVYVAASDGHDVLVFASTDQGATWSSPTHLNPGGNAAIFPWGAAGGDGGVVVTWYQASTDKNDDPTNDWNVMAAQSLNGHAPAPVYSTVTVSDHPVRHGDVCTEGFACRQGRELGDFFQVAVGPDGFANIAYNDASGGGSVVVYARGSVNLGPAN
jgi:hypothetical protein